MLMPILIISGDHTRHERSYAALSGLSSVEGKSVVDRFDGGMLSSNSGVLALAEVENRCGWRSVWHAASMIRVARTRSSTAWPI
ncbi:hypothetical protein GGE07_005964 [Sinorhizobium terangae]|nr:hypothetical protein [Sinorhizobium terangae]